jgi:3-oxoacyl-[acyl-carrier-protein] synthase II
MEHDVLVAGCGVVTPFGYGSQALADAVFAGRSALEPVEGTHLEAKESWVGRLDPSGSADPLTAAVDEALEGFPLDPAARVAVVVPTCGTAESMVPPPREWPPDPVPGLTARLPGPFAEYRVTAACSSTTVAAGLGRTLLRADLADVVLVAGVCRLNPYDYHSLAATGTMDRGPARPFDTHRSGMSLGEGAGAAVLVRAGDLPVGTTPRARLLGVASLCRARRPRTVDLEADTAGECMRRALPPGGAEQVDVVHAHAVGTKQGDRVEAAAIADLVGDDVPVSSHKGATGHLLHCSGFVALALACESLRRQSVAPSVGATEPDTELAVGRVLTEAEHRPIGTILVNNFGFAGNYASLTLAAA